MSGRVSHYRTYRRLGLLARHELPIVEMTLEELAEDARAAGSARAARAGAPVVPASSRAVQSGWVDWVKPSFPPGRAHFLTGTYSDAYGTSRGLQLARNVIRDFQRFRREVAPGAPYLVGVEKHRYRDSRILHLHALLACDRPDDELAAWWGAQRGFAKCSPVTDRGAQYVLKYAMKDYNAGAFDWFLR